MSKTFKTRAYSPIQDGLSAAVQVIKLLLCHRVVYIHRRHAQFSSFRQLIQPRQKHDGNMLARN